MPNPQSVFQTNIHDADALGVLYTFLNAHVAAPVSYDDLLRSRFVYAVSAFDKLIHDLVRIGMNEIFSGKRPATPKYLAEPIPLSFVLQLTSNLGTPPEVVFEQIVTTKLRTLTFQDPEKVSDGLSYIWNEAHKWKRIAGEMGKQENAVRTQLKLIVSRRNAIVHEADTDPITHQKLAITKIETDEVSTFLSDAGRAICRLVL